MRSLEFDADGAVDASRCACAISWAVVSFGEISKIGETHPDVDVEMKSIWWL